MQIDDVNKEWAGFEPNCDNRWELGPCKDGQMVRRRSYKVKIDYILEKPLFHHSLRSVGSKSRRPLFQYSMSGAINSGLK